MGAVVRDVEAEPGLIEFLRQERGRRGGTTRNKSVGGLARWVQSQGGVTRKADWEGVEDVSGHGAPVNRRTQPGRRGQAAATRRPGFNSGRGGHGDARPCRPDVSRQP
jgi:hypothetical protein